MRILISLVGVLASLIMLASSASMNYLFMYSLGKTELNSQILSAASVGADILKALLPFFISWAYINSRYAFAFGGSFMFVGLVGLSLLSASSFILGSREAVSGTLDEINADYQAAQTDLKHAKTNLDILSQVRPSNLVSADIDRAKRSRRWRATAKCTNATLPASQKFCREFTALQEELGQVTQKKRLEFKVSRLTKEISQLREAGAGQDGDPQVGLLARVFDIERDWLTLTINFFIAIVIELGSDLGIFFATSWGAKQGRPGQKTNLEQEIREEVDLSIKPPVVAETRKAKQVSQAKPKKISAKPKSKLPKPAKRAGEDSLSYLMTYCLDQLHPDYDSASVTIAEVYSDFVEWTDARQASSVEFDLFQEQFLALAVQAGIAIENDRCLNLRIGPKEIETHLAASR